MYHKTESTSPHTSNKVLIVLHGILEHSLNYNKLIDKACQQGITVYAFDLQGHGKSSGKRAHIEKFSHFVDDLNEFIQFVLKDSKKSQLILLGHSMGGLIASYYTANNATRVSKLILLSPCLGFKASWSELAEKPLEIFSSFFPNFYFKNIIKIKHLTHDKKMLDHITNDPLRQKQLTAKFLYEFHLAVKESFALAEKITVPTHIFQAGQDPLVSISKSKLFYAYINNQEKSYTEYPKLYHEIINEKERSHVIKDIIEIL